MSAIVKVDHKTGRDIEGLLWEFDRDAAGS